MSTKKEYTHQLVVSIVVVLLSILSGTAYSEEYETEYPLWMTVTPDGWRSQKSGWMEVGTDFRTDYAIQLGIVTDNPYDDSYSISFGYTADWLPVEYGNLSTRAVWTQTGYTQLYIYQYDIYQLSLGDGVLFGVEIPILY